MRSKWRLKKGSDTLIIVRRADVYPEELRSTGAKLSDGDLDNWLVNESTRKLALEIFESVNGRSQLDLKRAHVDELRRSVKPKLFQAFQRGDLIALRVSQLFLTQSPMEAAQAEAQQAAARKRQAPPAPPPPKQKTWIEIQLLDEEGNPIPKEQYRLELPNGVIEDGFLDKDGRARRDGIDPGMCKVSFPYLELVPKRKTPPPQPDDPPKPDEKKKVTVTIKAENGTDPPPAKIPVNGSIKLKAVPSEGTGTYQWKTSSAKITLANDTAQVVTVTAGGNASASLNAETIELTFTPSGQAALAPMTHNLTVFTAAFSESPTQKYGYDDMDNAAGVLHHVSVKKNDTTTVRVKVAGGLTGADLHFTSDDATIADATPPASPGVEFDLTINGKAKDKKETTIHARAFNASGPILASIKVNVYKEKTITAKVAKIHDSTVAASALSRPNFDVEAAETEINKWYKALVATIDLTDNSATGGATDVNYDLNGNGRLDLEPGTTSTEEAKIKAAFNPAGQKVVIVKELAWLYFLKTAAAVGDTTITLKDAYADYMKFIHVGDIYNLGDGANQESIKVKTIAGTTITLDVALTKAHPVTDGLIFGLNGLSGNPIYVKEQGLSEAQVRQVIGHENGHSQLSLKDLTPTANLMHHSTQTRTDIKLRFKEQARHHDPGNENQWETVPR